MLTKSSIATLHFEKNLDGAFKKLEKTGTGASAQFWIT